MKNIIAGLISILMISISSAAMSATPDEGLNKEIAHVTKILNRLDNLNGSLAKIYSCTAHRDNLQDALGKNGMTVLEVRASDINWAPGTGSGCKAAYYDYDNRYIESDWNNFFGGTLNPQNTGWDTFWFQCQDPTKTTGDCVGTVFAGIGFAAGGAVVAAGLTLGAIAASAVLVPLAGTAIAPSSASFTFLATLTV